MSPYIKISRLILAIATFGLLSVSGVAVALETSAKQAILIDFETGNILFEKNADDLMPPASMSKMMTVYMVFERLRNGSLNLTDELLVSEKAWKKGGSKMFVEVGKNVSIDELLHGIIVQSGNDACIVVAEGLAGSEEEFARQMTERAHELGLENTTFRNATGWPDPEHVTTARDLATLATLTIRNFPEFYELYGKKSYTYNDIKQGNRNPLLYKSTGADGLKTGHTEASGYGLTASATRGERRLILVVNGLDSVRARSEESERLLAWGFREFDNVRLFDAGATVAEAEVWLGNQTTVPLVVEERLTVTVPNAEKRDLKVAAVFDGPLPAPIVAGTPVARLVVSTPERTVAEIPLFAGADVAELGFFGRLAAAAKHLVFGAATSVTQ